MINGISGYGAFNYAPSFYHNNSPRIFGGEDAVRDESRKVYGIGADDPGKANGTGRNDPRKVNGSDSPKGVEECQTCKNRKYQDGSNENVSFKAAAHVSPEAAGSAVRAHEGEHVSNAYTKAAQNNGKVIRASVSIHTSVCPECGRTYVSGGTTNTAIKYSNEENPYVKNLKAQQAESMKGRYIDYLAS